jgi:hypothetical protein
VPKLSAPWSHDGLRPDGSPREPNALIASSAGIRVRAARTPVECIDLVGSVGLGGLDGHAGRSRICVGARRSAPPAGAYVSSLGRDS